MTGGWVYLLYILFALGGIGVYLAMPRPAVSYARAGAVIGAAALAGLLALLGFEHVVPNEHNAFFYFFAFVAVFAAGRVVTHPVATYSAMYFALVVLCVAVLMVIEQAEFLAAALVIIYAGAILVTYAFVLMLAQQTGVRSEDVNAREPLLAILVSFVLAGAIAGKVAALAELPVPPPSVQLAPEIEIDMPVTSGHEPGGENTVQIGRSLFGQYVVAVQLAGLLLLVAMVGAIAIARKRVPVEETGGPPPAIGMIGREVPPY